MSIFKAQVYEIKNVDALHIVKFSYADTTLSMMSLELDSNIKVGTNVHLYAKTNNIALAKNLTGDLSYSNQIKAKINSIQNGELLSKVILQGDIGTFESVITKDSASRMALEAGDEIVALIKASELSISEVLDD
ncbi:transporter [Sulfurimonas lithotrophica]|uniref:Transporter n=1 Tax=Sulfurimonas lithotrophica TaxID=2590022 RepID=A0A5P8P3G8_9BACT|nr:TOBE domain-containing protein [Sulfurimonas lithotrophica]QFR50080.1 transporter [Sulfurimonas lithotrophica]